MAAASRLLGKSIWLVMPKATIRPICFNVQFAVGISTEGIDSLQRHIVKHGAVFKQNPSGRSKRACLACRAGKTKCDGNDNCAKCLKRGIECKYGEEDSRRDESPSRSQRQIGSPIPTESISASRTSARDTIDQIPTTTPKPLEIPPSLANGCSGLVDWASTQIRPDPKVTTGIEVGIDRDLSQKYLDAYFEHFHDRWPVVHRPSVEEEIDDTDLCELSMRMIGGWIVGTTDSIQFALDTHNVLMDHIMSQLSQVTSKDSFQQSLPAWMCMAAVLNIHDREVSRAIILWNVLMAVLRQVGFFKSETAWTDEKKGYFIPLRQVRIGQRQRLAYNLFKINAYVSILRNLPMSIQPEELHFSLPSTFSLYNSNGLHIWEERQVGEPPYRASKSMYSLIADDVQEIVSIQEQPMIIEDISLCLCALQSDIWKHLQRDRSQTCEVNDVLQRDSLRKHLDRLKSRLDRTSAQKVLFSKSDFSHEEYLPYRYYYGYEDHTQAGWQEIVAVRVNRVLFDTVMLSFLLSLHLSVDVRKLGQLAKDRRLSTVEELSEAHGRAREQRHVSMKGWAATPAARWAVCQSVDVLVTYQNFKNRAGAAEVRYLDPICHIALCVSALILWTFCEFYDHGCVMCLPGEMAIVELTRWSMTGNQFKKDKENWLEMGGRYPRSRPQVQGIQLCRCNTEFVTALFQACLPEGWAIADSIAPGIFKGIA
ncbi:uncharacterized protein LY89DRAFT_733387 [Mollisia scopiformis]|uniref:Zn(2)-C6 fungal-type domain-containing protein n=1 Tax=Mollisia scopiformis TaxID=149040 RepID=A0A194XBL1_MOLSC|nr:uncharacterized protein LY89DRAFT_733387 [Mollisia scopiformis]KUJ17543.1 hypothetical protein LY89DRAFT_733387 [Mollisia scopiformis]